MRLYPTACPLAPDELPRHHDGMAHLFQELESPRDIVSNITPNWFASVMGTGIVGNALANLPGSGSVGHAIGTAVWVLAAVMLVVLVVATIAHWVLFPRTAVGHHRNPGMVNFYGAPPMAIMTVGSGALYCGQPLLGADLAWHVSAVLWLIGTVLGLYAAGSVPYLAFTRLKVGPKDAFGGWLMPLVPPMVSAAGAVPLLAHLQGRAPAQDLLIVSFLLMGVTFFPAVIIIALLWNRLVVHKVGASGKVPTLWIVLGPLGQTATAAIGLSQQGSHMLTDAMAGSALAVLGLAFGTVVLGFALLWALVVGLITIGTVRGGMPFNLTWWSFTFPVGTVTTGFAGVANVTGSTLMTVIAWLWFALLAFAWTTVAVRTFHGAIIRGSLLAPPRPAAATPTR